MAQEIMPCLSFPTSVVFVDDDAKYLQQMGAIIRRQFPCVLYRDPKEALKFFKEVYRFDPFTNRCMVEAEDIFPDHRIIDFNIRMIRKEAFNPNRSKEISVVVIDFAMPDINGGELARQLSGLPLKIVLLTGEADAQTAVNLFNEGVIHSYIRKDNPHLKTLLLQTIKNLQQQYFQDISKAVLDNFPSRSWPKDLAFKTLIYQTMKENNLIEFFLVDEFGSYYFLNPQGKSSFLAIANEDMMQTYLLLTKDFDMPKKLLEGIKAKSMMPFFLTEKDFSLAPPEWGPYMHPVQVLKGEEDYYYSYISKPDADVYGLKEKILSYDEFLRLQG